MSKIIIFYLLFQLLLFIVLLAVSSKLDKRNLKSTHIPEGFVPTKEKIIDPEKNEQFIVYYHPKTGERIYIEDKE